MAERVFAAARDKEPCKPDIGGVAVGSMAETSWLESAGMARLPRTSRQLVATHKRAAAPSPVTSGAHPLGGEGDCEVDGEMFGTRASRELRVICSTRSEQRGRRLKRKAGNVMSN